MIMLATLLMVAACGEIVVTNKVIVVTNSVASGYYVRGGIQYWVYIGGQPHRATVQHLMSGERTDMFDETWLRTLSQEDLDWLHSHAHANRVDWSVAKRSKWRTERVCINGVCTLRRVRISP